MLSSLTFALMSYEYNNMTVIFAQFSFCTKHLSSKHLGDELLNFDYSVHSSYLCWLSGWRTTRAVTIQNNNSLFSCLILSLFSIHNFIVTTHDVCVLSVRMTSFFMNNELYLTIFTFFIWYSRLISWQMALILLVHEMIYDMIFLYQIYDVMCTYGLYLCWKKKPRNKGDWRNLTVKRKINLAGARFQISL